MATITFTIDDAKLQRVKDGVLEVYPNDEKDENDDPIYTDNEWLKELVRRFIVQSVKRGESKKAQEAARAALLEADSLVS